MDDFLSFLLVAVIYLFAALSKAGKKGKRDRERQRPMRTRARGEQRDKRLAEKDRHTQAGFDDAFVTPHNAAESPAHACGEERQMHLHEATQQQFAHALEGDDPCHAGQSAFAQEEELYDVRETDAHDNVLAQDVLRGVVMSEILMRPHERAALRRGRR